MNLFGFPSTVLASRRQDAGSIGCLRKAAMALDRAIAYSSANFAAHAECRKSFTTPLSEDDLVEVPTSCIACHRLNEASAALTEHLDTGSCLGPCLSWAVCR